MADKCNITIQPFSVQPMDSAALRWEKWVRRFDEFLAFKDITAESGKQTGALLLYAGEEVLDIADSLDIKNTTAYATAKTKLEGWFAPAKNTEFEKYQFRQAVQQQGETVAQFCARLTRLAKHCEFGDADAIAAEVKSQLIQKCTLDKVREKGLTETTISLANLKIFAHGLETSAAHRKVMVSSLPQGATAAPQVHRVTANQNSKGGGKNVFKPKTGAKGNPRGKKPSQCPGCGNPTHDNRAHDCPAWGKSCNKCHRDNQVCRQKSTHYVDTGTGNRSAVRFILN